MEIKQVTHYRRIVAGIGAICCIVFFSSILDGLIALIKQPVNLHLLVRGESAGVNGPLPENVNIGDLKSVGTSGDVRVSFEGLQTGFWLGGRMWRGIITAAPSADPGEHTITVFPGAGVEKPLVILNIRVFASHEDLLKNSWSILRSRFGASPWLVAGAFAVLLLPCFGAVYLISQKRDNLLAAQGRAEIYRVVAGPEGSEVYFGLGTSHNVHPGSHLTLYDTEGVPRGSVKVLQSTETDSLGEAEATAPVRMGFVVSRDA